MVVTSEQDWDRLVHTAGLVLVDVYSGWCGPCSSMEAHLKRLRMASIMAEDRVSLARACCDHIEELAPFRKDPRPTWYILFFQCIAMNVIISGCSFQVEFRQPC